MAPLKANGEFRLRIRVTTGPAHYLIPSWPSLVFGHVCVTETSPSSLPLLPLIKNNCCWTVRVSLSLYSERCVFINLAHGFFWDTELRDRNEEMRRKGKDPCVLGQFLGSPLLEEKKKKHQWYCWYTKQRIKFQVASKKSLINLVPCRPFWNFTYVCMYFIFYFEIA